MSKKWIDANVITMIHELPDRKLRELDKEMRKKPNFEKEKDELSKKQYVKFKYKK